MAGMKTKTLKLSPKVIEALRESKYSVGVLTPPDRFLGKKVYVDFKEAITVMEGVYQPSKSCFHFPFHVQVPKLLKQAIETGEVTNRVQTFQEFFTPPVLANRMAALLNAHLRGRIRFGDTVKVLEPSAGKGAIVEAILKSQTAPWKWAITAIEIQFDNLNVVPSHPNVIRLNEDFLNVMQPVVSMSHDAAVMNPPFDHKTWLKHIAHAAKFVKVDGVLISVVPATAKLSDFEGCLASDADACITPVSFRFDDTNVKVAILTVGIPLSVVHKFFPPPAAEEKPLPKRVTVKSLDKYLAGIRKSVTALTHELDAIEDMLHE